MRSAQSHATTIERKLILEITIMVQLNKYQLISTTFDIYLIRRP